MSSTHPILFIPGPTEVDDELRDLLAMPALGHRDQLVKQTVVEVCELLAPLVGAAKGRCFVENVPGTGVMEASVRNLIRRRSLHLSCGSFGERWIKIAKACGREPTVVESDWGRAVTPDQLRAALRAERTAGREPFEAVCITHSETSTGVLNPLRELAAVVREESPDSLVLVDAVTSAFGVELDVGRDGLDLIFAGTQKCLALPPGLAFYAISDRALDRARGLEDRGWLLDFVANVERFESGATPATPCVPLFFALHRQLERITAEGIEHRVARHLAMRDRVRDWADEFGFPLLVEDEAHRSPTVTMLCNGNDEARSNDAVIARAKDAGFTLGKGYGKLKDVGFRIGHMGDHSLERLDRLLDAIRP